MRRDLYFVDSAARIREVLAEKVQGGLDVATSLGVGFFRGVSVNGDDGVGLQVSPALLRSHLLTRIGQGLVSPYSHEILYFGESSLSVCRWLLLGLQSRQPALDAALALRKTDWPDLKEANSVSEVVGALLRPVQTRVLDLRASQVVFLLDFDVLSQFVAGSIRQLSVGRKQLIAELVSWFSEEWLHPNTLLVCENSSDFSDLVLLARSVRLQSSSSEDLLFRL